MKAISLITLISSIALSVVARDVEYPYAIVHQNAEGECHVEYEGSQRNRVLSAITPVNMEKRNLIDDHHSGVHVRSEESSYEISAITSDLLEQKVQSVCKTVKRETLQKRQSAAQDELIPIVQNGDSKNRIDVVFMGDGYRSIERQRFVDDIKRLTDEMFVGNTFKSWLPLFNIWGLYRPSVESGIGVGGVPKNTAFGLYRDGTELRGIYSSKVSEARAVCNGLKGESKCDYPSLIGNDDYYGGLGGEFIIATRSPTSGTIVLRHEMGHNFISVGEEYDGGSVYSGVNAASSLANLGWKHWVTGDLKEQVAALVVQDYSWYNLAKGAYKINFTSKGGFKRWYLSITVSGAETDGSFEAYLDGKKLAWKSAGVLDRSFYNWIEQNATLSSGNHVLEFRQGTAPGSGKPIRQLCSVSMYEYAGEPDFHWDNQYINAYPTWSDTKRKTYRPTNEFCLMRNMTSDSFCSVCKEGMWQQFLSKITLIDSLTATPSGSNVNFKLSPIPLAQFRKQPLSGEKYSVTWSQGGQVKAELNDKFEFSLPATSAKGQWSATLKLTTLEVRKDTKNLLTASKAITVQ
ncbi:hypothetical protein K7432_009661 [Basidiobolus ranarum]|uniref:IgA Peptidase M64 n=1 Tax=Basidiobolus ranarum TaxID=34480 RepID=A0ABR2VWP6_9FUNG